MPSQPEDRYLHASIPVWVSRVDEPETGEDAKGGILARLRGKGDGEVVLKEIPVETLRANLTSMTQAIIHVLSDIREVGQFQLKEVELQVEISAEGGVEFIGTAKIGGKGAVTLTFQK